MYRRLSEPQNQFGSGGEEEKSLTLLGIEPQWTKTN
jgi:hypothetical protein